jgi:glycosyltransferase involved in cell wall biosynthesis
LNARTTGGNEFPEVVPLEYNSATSTGMPNNLRRVLILSEIISPYRIPVFNALAQDERVDLRVVFLSETDSGLRQWRVYKEEIRFAYEVLPSARFRAGRSSVLLNWKLRSCLEKFAPEAIICGGYNYVASWEALWWGKNHGAEVILWSESNRHDARSGLAVIESLKSYFLSRCDRFVVPGRASREYLESLGSGERNIFLAPNAVDNGRFRGHADAARSQASEFRARLGLPLRYLLFVGRFVREKGILDLLEAYAALDAGLRSGVGLVFAGDGPARPELEARARTVCPGKIMFPGFLHREDLAGVYALAECLALPTHSDTWGLVVNEGMACGSPIIVTDVAGCATDLVEDGWNGYIVSPHDPARLSVALDSLLKNPQLREKMSLRSIERIRSYSPEACAEGLAAAALARASEVKWMTG